jgi:hypothetical protein
MSKIRLIYFFTGLMQRLLGKLTKPQRLSMYASKNNSGMKYLYLISVLNRIIHAAGM